MPSQPHPAVLTVHEAAKVVMDHVHHPPTGFFWRRWFEKPDERHFADEIRAFIRTLGHLLDVPPQLVTREDIAAIGDDCEGVVKNVEASIDDPSAASDVASLTPAIYVIRARYEELYKRGAGLGN